MLNNSSLVRDLPCTGVRSGTVLESFELFTSLATEAEDQYGACETADKGCDDVVEHHRRSKGSKVGIKNRAKRTKRPK